MYTVVTYVTDIMLTHALMIFSDQLLLVCIRTPLAMIVSNDYTDFCRGCPDANYVTGKHLNMVVIFQVKSVEFHSFT